jgi:hypothetical protein
MLTIAPACDPRGEARARCDRMVEAMDEALLHEEINHQEELLRIQRRHLRALEIQVAKHGPLDVPLHIQGARDDLRDEIVRIERTLRDLRARLRRLHRK